MNRADSIPPLALGGAAADVSGTAQVGASAKATAARATPAKRAPPKRKGKSKAQAQSDSEPESDDDEYTPAKGTPTPVTKRRKTSGEVKTAGEVAEQPKAKIPPFNPNDVTNAKIDASKWAEWEERQRVQREKDAARTSIVGRENPEGDTIQALLQKHGVDTPSKRYDQHLLQRVMPVTHDPVIGSAPANLKSSTLGGVMDKEMQGKAKIGSEFDLGNNPTVRDFVKAQGPRQAHLRGRDLDEDRKTVLHGSLIASTLTLLSKLNIEIASGSGSLVTLGLDTNMNALNVAQRSELEHVIEQTSLRVLNELFPSDAIGQTPSKRDQESAVVLANMSGGSPRLGLFRASPSRRESGRNLPSPFEQPTPFQLAGSDTPGASGPAKERTESGGEQGKHPVSGPD